MKLLIFLLFALAAAPAAAGTLKLDGELKQGSLVFGTAEPGAKVWLGERSVRVSEQGRFLIGFGRDAPGQAILRVEFPDGSSDERRLKIAERSYNIQRIDGLPPNMVTPPDDVLARIRRENAKIGAVRQVDRPEPHFESGFIWPAQGRISGVYGSQRILNGEPRRPHFGIDIAAPKGTPILAPADGVIALAEDDLYYTGGTIILDHGHGLTSAFLHMETVTAEVGQFFKKGEVMGTLGSTGRSTGPHLDWRINWFNQRVDPALLVPPMPATN